MSEGIPQRHANRMALVQFLYMMEMNPPLLMVDRVRTFFSTLEQPREYYDYAEEIIAGIVKHLEDIDGQIRSLSQNCEFSRIAQVDLAILRLGVFELLHRQDVPPVVIINEAIELSREFSTDDSSTFINGILDKVMEQVERHPREKEG